MRGQGLLMYQYFALIKWDISYSFITHFDDNYVFELDMICLLMYPIKTLYEPLIIRYFISYI